MAKRKQPDQMSPFRAIKLIGANFWKARNRVKRIQKTGPVDKSAKRPAPTPEPRDPRTPEQLESDIERTRAELVATVARIKYDLDVPARLRDVRDDIAAKIPEKYKGEQQAMIAAGAVVVAGLGIIVGSVVSAVRHR